MYDTMDITPYCYNALITKVYDGDTVTALVDLGFKIKTTIKVRLAGINAPEVRGKSRPEGLKTRDFLRDLILDQEVIIQTQKDKKGKYGRYIGVIYLKDKNVNELLVEKKLAVKKEYQRVQLSGRASPCQGEGREFKSHHPLQNKGELDGKSNGRKASPSQSGKI